MGTHPSPDPKTKPYHTLTLSPSTHIPGEIGVGWAPSFAALVFWRAVTGVGSSVQYAGRELYLADISRVGNRGRTLGAVTVHRQTLQCQGFGSTSCQGRVCSGHTVLQIE